MESSRFFASDNASGIHPEILAAIEKANRGHALAYGNDAWTEAAVARLRAHFGENVAVAFTFGGTGANVLGLRSVLDSVDAVICAASSHLWTDECAAPEHNLGGKLIPLPSGDGKISAAQIEPLLADRGMVHRAQPRVVSISQPTEWGTAYTIRELRALADFCHEHGMLLHADGARLANAAAHLECSLGETSGGAGVDVLSFGGTKNGLLLGEAVVIFDPALARRTPFHQKQCMQLASKMRFIAAQFEALLAGDLWLRNARHSNAMAGRLRDAIAGVAGVEILQPVETNAVFLRMTQERLERLQQRFFFHFWNRTSPVARIMMSFDTTPDDVDALAAAVHEVAAAE